MSFESIEQENFDVVKSSVKNLTKAAEYVSELQDGLRELFSQSDARSTWGVDFLPNEEGLGAAMKTPFGSAKAAAYSVIKNGKAQIRYVFEKEIRNQKGEPLKVAVWAVCIDGNGTVSSDDGKHIYIELNSFDDRRTAVGVIGLSATYAIGTEIQNAY